MYKKLIIISFLFFASQSISQVANLLPQMDEVSADYTLFSIDNNQVTYRFKGVYSAFYENKFKIFDAKTGESKDLEVESANYKGAQGLVTNYIIKNSKIFEILLFKGSKTSTSSYNAVLIRDLKTLKQIGEIVVFDEIKTAYMGAGQGFEILESENGFYVLAGSKYLRTHYLKHFSDNGAEDWSTSLEMLDDARMELKKASVSENNNILLSVLESTVANSSGMPSRNVSWRNKSLKFINVDNVGEATTFSAQFDNDLTVTAFDFKYYPERKEIVGILSITKTINSEKNETSGIGYCYMTWDLGGDLLNSKNYYLTYNDLDSKELQHFIESTKVKKNSIESGKELPSISMDKNFKAFFQEDGSVIVAHENFRIVENGFVQTGGTFERSKLLYCINPDGELKWSNFYPNDLAIDFSANNYTQNQDQLYIYSKFTPNNFGEIYADQVTVASNYEDSKRLLIMERIIDISTGSVKSFKPVLSAPLDNFSGILFYNKQDILLMQYNNSKKNTMRLAVIKP